MELDCGLKQRILGITISEEEPSKKKKGITRERKCVTKSRRTLDFKTDSFVAVEILLRIGKCPLSSSIRPFVECYSIYSD